MVFIPFLFSLALLIQGLYTKVKKVALIVSIYKSIVCVWSTFHQQLVNAFVCTFFVNKIVWRLARRDLFFNAKGSHRPLFECKSFEQFF